MAFEAKNITCCFGRGEKKETVVEDLSFSFGEGEMVALVGKKRSGKSSVMNVLAGLDKASAGECFVDGKQLPVGRLLGGAGWRAKKLGIITKTPMLVSELTVYENVMLPLHHRLMTGKNKLRRAKEVLRSVGLRGKGKYYPHELNTMEQQLVCTARALVHDPAYLLADEPTACLEGGDVERYLDLLEVLCSAGKGILIATYSKRVASRCHRIVPIVKEEVSSGAAAEAAAAPTVSPVPGHTLAGAIPEETPEARQEREREAYEKDEAQDIAISEDFDTEFEHKLGNNIEGVLQEEQTEQ